MRLSRTPAGIPHGVGFVNPFPLARKCDLDCLPLSVRPQDCQFEVCLSPFFFFITLREWVRGLADWFE